ncbi:IS66 Orf2 like protein [Acidovorax sp. 100]|uniref:IS66 family insertion sequence element accessory protein TnpB n=1 Tax=Acidovorax sp. 100 TaxID=2135635 RepID=UPI000F2D8E46|nr:IS66 family insertion sequence element accessory protein TnpB [Acidovorax sp. 100]RMA59974.1 IS66 Orf2 like protein [Acidovorax sp. 100]
MIRIDAVWLAITPMDMRAGTETALARVVAVFGAAHPHTAYLFANKRGTRLKVLVHDGMGIWLATRRLHQGRFYWPSPGGTAQQCLQREQLDALVLGLPWQRIGEAGVITLIFAPQHLAKIGLPRVYLKESNARITAFAAGLYERTCLNLKVEGAKSIC